MQENLGKENLLISEKQSIPIRIMEKSKSNVTGRVSSRSKLFIPEAVCPHLPQKLEKI